MTALASPRRTAPRRSIDGILVVDKPRDWTSHDVVAKLRNYFRLAKLGHAGTLDPIATGVLVLLVGRGTKLAEQLLADEKEYRFTARFGLVTDTQDVAGKTLQEDPMPPPRPRAEIEQALLRFHGDIEQTPPMFSAVKINGTRLYKLGRKGAEVERAPRRIRISTLVLEKLAWPRVTLRAVCSKGTYVRTLCHDLGAALGVGGCMESLERLRSGAYAIDQAKTLEHLLALTPEQFANCLLPLPPAPRQPRHGFSQAPDERA
jgi:tRNA pseudouridine55 synthase